MADSSFDIVSKLDRQEIDNAINQAARELTQRFDFKNTGATIELAPATTASRSRPTPTTGRQRRARRASRTS